MSGATVSEVLDEAVLRYGPEFAEILDGSVVWLNGDPASPDDPVGEDDEVAVLPPVSGGDR